MKRILSAILVLCLLLALSGCAAKEYTLVEEKIIDTYDYCRGFKTAEKIVSLFKESLSRANNTRRAADIVTKQYPLSLMQESASLVSHYGFSDATICITASNLDAWYTVEAIRKVNDALYYVVYKIKEGGWLYLFLEVDTILSEEYHEPYLFSGITHSIYIKEKADKKALAAIGEGSSFADVCAADPSAALAREYEINRCYTYVAAKQKHSLHWVDNEVFVFTYDETGETVTGTEHYPDGRVLYEEVNYIFDYNLLPIDCK